MRVKIALMETVMQKFKDIDFVPDELEDLIEDVKDGRKELGGELAFWKKE